MGRKSQIEAARQDPNTTGYEYWLIADYPGGTGEGDSREEGWFDFFWRPKGVTPEQGRELNSAVLPLIDATLGNILCGLKNRRRSRSPFRTTAIAASGDVGSWRITSGGQIMTRGRFVGSSAALGKITPVGEVTVAAPSGSVSKLELAVDIDGYTNRWQFWSFPKASLLKQLNEQVVATGTWTGLSNFYPFNKSSPDQLPQNGVWITPTLDDAVLSFLRSGGRVWLALNKESRLSFFPASGGALGTVIERHPALDGFPNEGFADLQFYSLMEHATPFELDTIKNIRPILGGIRTRSSFPSKSKDLSKVGYIFEARFRAPAGHFPADLRSVGRQSSRGSVFVRLPAQIL